MVPRTRLTILLCDYIQVGLLSVTVISLLLYHNHFIEVIMSDEKNKEAKTEIGMKSDKVIMQERESGAMPGVGLYALNSLSVFSGNEDESAKLFLRDFEEALDLANVSADKYKKFHLKMKLRGIASEWYETTRDSDQYNSWDSVKKGFIQQFDKSQPRVKDINRRLMNIRQNVEKNETIQSMSFRITQLFNEFKQMTGKSLLNSEKVDYFIDAVFPNYREQLNNQYQQEDGSYNQCSFEDVVATALKLERNAKAYEQDMQRMTNDAVKLTINAVHKPMNPKSHVTEKSCRTLSEVPRRDIIEEASENERQNTEDIKQIQKEQVVIRDQLAAVTNALQGLGEQMRGIRASVENLRYERIDCTGTANLMYGHRFKGTYNNDNTKNQYTKRYEDPRLYNAGRANDGQLQGNCFKCGRKGHYAIACRVQMYNKTGSSQVVQNSETVNGNHSQQIEMQQQNLDQQPQDIRSNTSATESRLHSAERKEERSGAITRSMKQRSGANHVSVINLTNQHNVSDDGVRLLKLKGQIGKTQLKDIVFDSGAAISN